MTHRPEQLAQEPDRCPEDEVPEPGEITPEGHRRLEELRRHLAGPHHTDCRTHPCTFTD